MKMEDFDKVQEYILHHRSLHKTLLQAEAASSISLSFDGKVITVSQSDLDIICFAEVQSALGRMLHRNMTAIESRLREYGVTQ